MLNGNEQAVLSDFEGLYDRIIPSKHMLRQFNELVDFSFVYKELHDKYCLDNGRNAESPVRLFKYLILKAMYEMSDGDLVERSKFDMSFKYFLGYRPEDDVISKSLLSKFRKLRLVDEELMDKLLTKTVGIALGLGIIKSKSIIVDSVHTVSRFHNRKAQEVLQEQAKKLRVAIYRVDESIKGKFPAKVTNDNLDEHIAYCEKLLDVVAAEEKMAIFESVTTAAGYLREMLDDNLEHLRTSADGGAKVGHKSADTSFFGYKTHLAMTEEGIITAASVTSGEKMDGKELAGLVEKSRAAGVEVDAVIGDGAYSEKENIEYAKDNFELVSRLSSTVTKGYHREGDGFEYNKDAGMYVCPAGHMAAAKTKRHNRDPRRKENPRSVYYFDIKKCKRCPKREGCYKEGAKTKTYSVSITSDIQKEHQKFQDTERFKEMASHRYKIEAKNGELKNRHGYSTAYSTGLQAMRIQGAAALFVANLKRIVRLRAQY
ncbi:MAG: IS1182 family transposase [Oscillospiraceae bacterium]|nr:IS1182 family transposase [Oscillospiraceae bacterium]